MPASGWSSFHTWRRSGPGYSPLFSELEEVAELHYVKGAHEPNDCWVNISNWTRALKEVLSSSGTPPP